MHLCTSMEESCFIQMIRRETSSSYSNEFRRRNHVNEHLIQNLQLEAILEGHTGCVNCLDWNESGTLLASGSDDTKVVLWDVIRHKSAHVLNTQHHGNIFSVKFMPHSGDHVVATGAADGHIFLHDLIAKEAICTYNVEGRIKRIVTTKAEPNIIISASEDGIVREYDTREHSPSSERVLVDLTRGRGSCAECKCVAICPTNENCIAVGANDPYVRLYDRRMLDMDKNGMYFTPGHLRSKQGEHKRRMRNFCVTYLAFNPRGSEILVNLGGEQVYIFDIYDKAEPLLLDSKMKRTSNGVKKHSSNGLTDMASGDLEHVPKRYKSCSGSTSSSTEESVSKTGTVSDSSLSKVQESKPVFHSKSDICRVKGNELFSEHKYAAAISMYNKALLFSPRSVTYSNRAAAFIKREWDGDFYAALKDCYSALHVNPSDVKAHYRLARCMFELEWFEEAWSCIKEFKLSHPEHSQSNACIALEKDIHVALKQKDNGKKSKHNNANLSPEELTQRMSSYDYKYRYCGHCNTTTDIKEANFFGDDGQYIVAGSDEGSFFVWERKTTNLVRVMQADSSIVNCLQPHPCVCTLATSGIDNEVKLWSPKVHEHTTKHVIHDMDSVAGDNQKRMNTDPLESMLISMGMHLVSTDDENHASEVMPCRPT